MTGCGCESWVGAGLGVGGGGCWCWWRWVVVLVAVGGGGGYCEEVFGEGFKGIQFSGNVCFGRQKDRADVDTVRFAEVGYACDWTKVWWRLWILHS